MANTATSAGTKLAARIVESALSNTSLLNWDGVTSKEDLLENIRSYVCKHAGWKSLSVELRGSVLEIATNDPEPAPFGGLLLVYDLATYRQVYGRPAQIGLGLEQLEELRQWLAANPA